MSNTVSESNKKAESIDDDETTTTLHWINSTSDAISARRHAQKYRRSNDRASQSRTLDSKTDPTNIEDDDTTSPSLHWIDSTSDAIAARRHAQKHRRAINKISQKPTARPNQHIGRLQVKRIPPPSLQPASWRDLTHIERSNLVFFDIRTRHQCSGWEDEAFWALALSLSHTSNSIAHGLAALGAFHNGDELASYRACTKSLRVFSTSEALVSCLLLICFQGLTGQSSFQLLKHGIRLLEHSTDQSITSRVAPLFERLKARPCMMQSLPASLQMVVAKKRRILRSTIEASGDAVAMQLLMEPHIPDVPRAFASHAQAKICLEQILKFGCDCLVVEKPLSELRALICDWEIALTTSLTDVDLLHAAGLFGLVLIESTFGFRHETICARILDLLAVHTNMCFGIDNGLIDILTFIGVRCASLRPRVLELLGQRIEGDRRAVIPASIIQNLGGKQMVEGRQLRNKLEIQFSDGDVRQIPGQFADATFGVGYAEYRDGDDVFRLELEEFFFPIPKV